MNDFSGEKSQGGAGGDYPPPIPADQYPAALVAIIDLGTQEITYQNNDPEWKRKIFLVWDVNVLNPEMVVLGGDLVTFIGPDAFRFSFHPSSTLLQWLEAWRGGAYKDGEKIDLVKCLGQSCLLTIIQGGSGDKIYNKIDDLTKLPAMMAKHKVTPSVPLFKFLLGEDLAGIPKWVPFMYGKSVQTHIGRSEEMAGGRTAGAKGNAVPDNGKEASAKEAARAATQTTKELGDHFTGTVPQQEEAAAF